MAEEVIYDQVETGDQGPGDPLGIRKKLSQSKTTSGDPLGIRRKLAEPPPSKAATAPFKPMTDWLNISTETPSIEPENVVNDHNTKVEEAKSRVNNHLLDIDNSINNLIRDRKQDLQSRVVNEQLGINPKEIGPINQQAQALESKMRQAIPVDEQEVKSFKDRMAIDIGTTRMALNQKAKDLKDKDPKLAAQLKSDVYRLDRQNDASADKKISENIEKINNGEYDYDINHGQLVKPEGFFGSLITGYKEKIDAFDDYDVYKTGDTKAILDRIKERTKYDPDKAIPVPEEGWGTNALAEMGRGIGGQPIKPIVAGLIAGRLGPQAGGAAMAAVSVPEMYKLTFGSMLPHNYEALKKENPNLSEEEVLQRAVDLTNNQANSDAAIAGLMGGFGAKAGFASTGLKNQLLQKSIRSALGQIGQQAVKKTVEGLGVGAIGAGGQLVKNIMAQKAGIPTDETEGMAQQLWGGVNLTMGMTILAKFPELLKPKTYNQLLQSLKNVPTQEMIEHLNELESNGQITPEQSKSVQNSIEEHKTIDNSIKPNVPESDRIKVQELIRKRNELESSLETTDKAYHPDIKEEIKNINEQILNISKGNERGELQKLVDQEHKSGNIEGFVTETLRDASENDLKKYFKEIAEQAHDPNSAQTTLDTFGENIVNKAKELFPASEVKESTISVTYPKKTGTELTTEGVTVIKPESKSSENVSIIQPGEIKHPETITIKPKENAIPERSAETVPVGETPGDSQQVGEGVSESGETSNVQGQPEPESKDTGEEKVSEPEMIGITHAQMDAVARELGLPEYEQSPETIAQWDKEARERFAKDPEAANKLINKLRNGDNIDHVDTRMMIMHMADLKARYNANPTPELLSEIARTKDLYNISGRQKGRELVARKGSAPVEESLADFHLRDVEFNRGAPLTKEQTVQSTKEYNEIKAAKDALDDKVNKLEAENAKLKAEKAIKKVAAEAKKSEKKDYKSERQQILKDIADKWKKSSKENLGASLVPYAKELAAIAPDVLRFVKNIVEEGVEKLPDVIKAVHTHLKDFIPHITEKDVHDIIAGEYNAKKPTRNELQEKIYNLKLEAKLINKLEALESGVQPKNERQRIKRNQEIEDLRKKIKDLQGDTRTNEEKLSALKARYKSDIEKLEGKLRNGDYSPDAKPEPIVLDKEAQDLKDKYIKLKQEREKRLAEQEYANRSRLQKLKDQATNVLNVPRTLMASVDMSAPLRQGIVASVAHPLTAMKAFPEMVKQALSQGRFDRWLTDLKESPEYQVMDKSGLYVADPNNLHLSAQEEQYMTNLAEKIPVIGRAVKGSERAYVAYLNKMRVDLFKQGMDTFESQGKTLENSPELYKGLADFINNATGRGDLGKLEDAAQVLNTAFFSPRLIASRINLLNPLYYTKLPKEVRIMALKDMGKFIAFGGAVLGLAATAGAHVELDPRSSDFGKIKVGNTRWDIWGGFQQYVRIVSQLLTGQTKSANSGEIRELSADKFPYKSRAGQLMSFFRGKLAPVPGTAIDILEGQNVVGEETTVAKKAYELFVPMIAQDIADGWKEQGPSAIATVGIPSFFGVGVSTYGGKEGGNGGGGAGASGKFSKPAKQSKPGKVKKS